MAREKDYLTETISKNLKKFRKEKNLSQLNLAAISDVHFTYYSQIERKIRPYVSVRVLLKISDALEVTLNDLVYD
jgi:transcriptional regulator with XRE-family HTH domain